MTKRQKIDSYFEANPEMVLTTVQVYALLFKDDTDTHRQSVSSILNSIIKLGGDLEIVYNIKNKNYYRYKKMKGEEPEFDDSNHEENRLKMMSAKWHE